MRVIAGKARSLPLKCIDGFDTRPTTDRIKETLFNILQPEIPGCRFLDLFSGSGAIGIEALSRGAKEAVFVENQRKAWSCIKDNLNCTRLTGSSRVLLMDALQALYQMNGEPAFDIIFMDPPYDQGFEKQVLEVLGHSSLADSHTTIVLETSKNGEVDWIEACGFTPWKIKDYKTNRHLFLGRTKVQNS